MPYQFDPNGKQKADPYSECGYVPVEGVPECPAAEAAGLANRDSMRWLGDEMLEMNDTEEGTVTPHSPNTENEDPATEAVGE